MITEGIALIVVLIFISIIVLILGVFYSKHRKIVIANSTLYKNIQLTNQKYNFDYSVKSVLFFNQVCKSKRGLENFNFEKNLQKIITDNFIYYKRLIDKVRNNSILWAEYINEYRSIENYSTQESIEGVDLSLKIFVLHERLLYKSSFLKKPTTDIIVKYVATYTSPAGKNSYRLDRIFSYHQFESLFNEVVKRHQEKELKEMAKEQRRIEQLEMRALLKNKGKLDQKEAELAKREQEFQRATQGHIYAVTETFKHIEIEQSKVEENEELLSAWEKMKRLKKTYENGEITYEEYNEKRKNLL